MFYARFINQMGLKEEWLYENNLNGWNTYYTEAGSPYCKKEKLICFEVEGKTYQERKNHVQELAIEWSHDWHEEELSYGEIDRIRNFFEKQGKRYGLLKEFRENCIC